MDDISISDRGLPRIWQVVDRWVVGASEVLSCMVGVTFTILVSLEVVSRYVFNFSIFLVNSAAGFLLVWFFMAGAGLALRQGAHVGLDFVVTRLPARLALLVWVVAQVLVFVFLAIMLWSGYRTLGPAMRQVEGALGISLIWVMLAFPVGFLLLIYHQITMVAMTLNRTREADGTP
jgi:C4-dicarboxylate transporter DctQ subunit